MKEEMLGFVGLNSSVANTIGSKSSKIYNNCRVDRCTLSDNTSIGDFSTVRETSLGERSTIQRNCDIWRMNAGRYTCIGRMSTIQATKIGSFCALSWNLRIGGDDHDYSMVTTHPFWHNVSWGISEDKEFSDEYHEKEYEEPCEIGNDVWIGAGVSICRNVRIGDGCVIGAGAVITKDIPPYSIVVGVPGRVIKKRFDDETIDHLEKIRWWDLPIDVIKENLSLFRDQPLNPEVLDKLEELHKKYLEK